MKKRFYVKILITLIIILLLIIACAQSPSDSGDTNIYIITFDKNDASVTGSMPAQAIASGSAANLATNTFTKTNWTFLGWATTAIGAVMYEDQVNYTMGTADVTLYAKWTATSYTITYNLNGGTNNVGNPAAYTVETTTITLQAPTKTSSTFNGWYDNSGFTGIAVTAIPQNSTGNKEFWAKWTYNDTYNLSLRDTGPAGGWIFYINPNAGTDGWKYLEAAPSDQSTAVEWIKGGSTQTTLNGNTLLTIGTGLANSNFIVTQDGHTESAAKVCLDYSHTNNSVTYDEWFLPSKDELNLMYGNLYAHGVGGLGTDEHYYWSSSEGDKKNAWDELITNGLQMNIGKAIRDAVRAARAF